MKKQSAVVDTNVALLANGKGSAGPECVVACAQALVEVKSGGPVVIDAGWRIIREYRNKLSPTGQPGPGDAFLKWLLSNLVNPNCCRQVEITPKATDPQDFEEFPDDPALRGFDRSDRKFVAVAVADSGEPPILQGFDSKWWGFKEALAECGVEVVFLCPEEIAEKFREKMVRR